MGEREKLLRSIARTERKLARMRARLEDEMRTAEQIKKDIEASEKALHSSRLDVARWQKLEEQLRAELAALPPAPVRLIIQYDVENYIDIGVANEPWVATVCKSRCGQHKIDPQALAAHILTFNQPDPNAEALKAADALAEAVAFTNGYFGAGIQQALSAYLKAREVQQ